jgi:hypothetical protein
MIKYAEQQYKIYHQSNGEFQLKLTEYTEFFLFNSHNAKIRIFLKSI